MINLILEIIGILMILLIISISIYISYNISKSINIYRINKRDKKIFEADSTDINYNLNSSLKNINYDLANLDTSFFKVYNEICSGYKIKYKYVKFPKLKILIINTIIYIILYKLLKEPYMPFFITFLTLIISSFLTFFIIADKEKELNTNDVNICEYHLVEKLGKILNNTFKKIDSKILLNEINLEYNNSNLCDYLYSELYVGECFSFDLNNNPNLKVDFYNIISLHSPKYSAKKPYNIAFSGILSKLNLDFNIDGFIKITKDTFINLYKNKIDLNNDYFENNLNEITNNKVLAMKLLTIGFISKLNMLKNNYDIDFEIYVNNNILYITFNEYIVNRNYVLIKPSITQSYDRYYRLKHLIMVYEFLYSTLKEVSTEV